MCTLALQKSPDALFCFWDAWNTSIVLSDAVSHTFVNFFDFTSQSSSFPFYSHRFHFCCNFHQCSFPYFSNLPSLQKAQCPLWCPCCPRPSSSPFASCSPTTWPATLWGEDEWCNQDGDQDEEPVASPQLVHRVPHPPHDQLLLILLWCQHLRVRN